MLYNRVHTRHTLIYFGRGVPVGEECCVLSAEVRGSIPLTTTTLSDVPHQFLVIDDLFTRYTIIVEPVAGITSVYCDECDMWVAEYMGDHISTHTQEELYEKILSDHKQDFPTLVEFSDDTVSFK